ncbi:putative acyl-CoA synthetase YngI isoform X2 [Antedon mediterranea]|uniref:putative acyl-CoA synthetase YngI isoform X2 n=1 Tax=Antedon mediterranea TaxID=105859 RepID=UPI003AF44FBE
MWLLWGEWLKGSVRKKPANDSKILISQLHANQKHKMANGQTKSYFHQPGIKPFIGLTMHKLLEDRVKEHPDREMHVFVTDNETLTFAEYKTKVVKLAAGLLHYGLCRGDCVAIVGANHMEWPLVFGATRALGIVTVCLQYGHPIESLKLVLVKTSAKLLILARSPETLYAQACKIIPELNSSTPGELKSTNIPTLRMVVGVGANHQSGTLNFEDIAISGYDSEVSKASKHVTIDDTSHIYMTSGTTGMPKLSYTTQFKALNETNFKCDDFNHNEVNRIACLCPVGYIAGYRMSQVAPLVLGATSVYPFPTYSFEVFLQAAQDKKCTNVLFLRNALFELAYSPLTKKYDLTSLKSGMIGGSPIPPEVICHVKKTYNMNVVITYGSTETAMISMLRHKNLIETASTVGQPLPYVEVQIVDRDEYAVKIGERGEVWVRNPVSFCGYYGDSETTKQVKNKHGWIKTGDIGKLDKDGYITIIGRVKDTIFSNNLNVYPTEVESVIFKHPAVKQVQVIGVPNKLTGEDVCACIRLKSVVNSYKEDLEKFCLDKIPIFAKPKHILVFEDEFPCGVTGKIDRRKLKEMAINRISSPETS